MLHFGRKRVVHLDPVIDNSHKDADWVRNSLLPRLEASGLRVCIDYRDFEIGAASIVNMELAVEQSRRTLLVLTPHWVNSEWTAFEAIMTQTADPIGLRRSMIPLMREQCKPPARIAMLTYVDFTPTNDDALPWARLVDSLRPSTSNLESRTRIRQESKVQKPVDFSYDHPSDGSGSRDSSIPDVARTKNDWRDGLTTEQAQAAGHFGSSARVLAGPGTGKTRSLIHHIAYLIQEQDVPPKEILALTFTRAAAKELQDRLVLHLNVAEADLPQVLTLHAFALRILLRYRAHSGVTLPLRVADDFEEKQVLWPEIGNMIGQTPSAAGSGIQKYVATLDTRDVQHPEWQDLDFRIELEQALLRFTRFYGVTLRGELIHRLLLFLEGNPHIGEELKLRHLLMDEYQDLNECDQQTIELLEDFGAELYIVGDDDQSIYDFRYASPDGIRKFTLERPDAGDYTLTICHRCPQNIVSRASALIRRDRNRIHRDLKPESSAQPGRISALQFKSQVAEADGIAKLCQERVNSGQLQPEDIVILLSRNRLADRIVEALERLDLPVTVLTPSWPLGNKNGDFKAGRLVYCVLRILNDRQDAMALRTWLGMQSGIGPATIEAVKNLCIEHDFTLWDGLNAISVNPEQVKRGKDVAERFDAMTLVVDSIDQSVNLLEAIDHVVEYVRSLDNKNLTEAHDFLKLVLANANITELNELILALQTFDIRAETQLQASAIRVMTIHKAKGLSAELVIIPALEQDLMPGQNDEALGRRLMYVAVTRSRRELVLTHARNRTGYQSHLGSGGGEYRRVPSQFLAEMRLRSEHGERFIERLGSHRDVAARSGDVDTAVLRQLLVEAFTDELLMYFCYDHFMDVYHQYGMGMSKTAKVHRLIEHCDRTRQFGILLELIRQYNTAQYERFEPIIYHRSGG